MFHAACRHSTAALAATTAEKGDRGTETTDLSPSAALDAMNSAYALCLADQWRDRRFDRGPPTRAAASAFAASRATRCTADKLILRPLAQPGAPFVMAELFGRGYHAHEDQVGAVLYYEYRDVPLLHGLGYHNRAAEQANLLFLCPADEPFPHKPQLVTPGVWHEASLPAKRLPMLGRDRRRPQSAPLRQAHVSRGGGPAGESVRRKPPPQRSEGRVDVGRFSAAARWHGGTATVGRRLRRPAGRPCGSSFAAAPTSCGATAWTRRSRCKTTTISSFPGRSRASRTAGAIR